MPELNADILDDVLTACRNGAGEVADALSRALDAKIVVTVGEAGAVDCQSPPDEWNGPGLIVTMLTAGSAALAFISEASGLLPGWYRSPDPTGESKLMTLAQELGMLVLPEAFMPDDFKAGRVANLAESLRRGDLPPATCHVPLELVSGDRKGVLNVVWPVAKSAEVFDTPEAAKEPAKAAPAAAAAPEPAVDYHFPNEDDHEGFERLPLYTRSLLRISVSVRVLLASRRQGVEAIVGLGPGQIIQFDKPCDDMLDLMVGDQRVARGEAVKVGEKFGLRVTSIVMPEERFRKVG